MNGEFTMFYNWDGSNPPCYYPKLVDEEYFDWLFSMLEKTGLTFLYRANLAGRSFYPSKLMAPFDHASVDSSNSDARIWRAVADMMDRCDPLAETVHAAGQRGIRVWVWWNWNEWQTVRPGYLDLVDRTWCELSHF